MVIDKKMSVPFAGTQYISPCVIVAFEYTTDSTSRNTCLHIVKVLLIKCSTAPLTFISIWEATGREPTNSDDTSTVQLCSSSLRGTWHVLDLRFATVPIPERKCTTLQETKIRSELLFLGFQPSRQDFECPIRLCSSPVL